MNKNDLTPAATILLFRDSPEGPKVLMVKRSKRPPFENLYVFPGGKVDDTDQGSEVASFCKNMTDEEASFQLNIKSGGLVYWIAAIRESFEEVGILMAESASKKVGEDDSFNTLLESYRKKLNAGDILLHEILSKEDLYLSLENMSPLSHWITPKTERKRYTTRFFIGAVPENQEAVHDGAEAVHSLWIRPEEALRQQEKGKLPMIMPTIANLRQICGFSSTDTLLQEKFAIDPKSIPAIEPKLFKKAGKWVGLLPGEPGYDKH